MKKLALIILLVGCLIVPANAEDKDMIYGSLYINDMKVNHSDTVIFSDGTFFPLRTIFEGLGAKVEWDEQTGNINVSYQGNSYLFEFKCPNSAFPEYQYIYCKNVQDNEYFILTSMSLGGMYRMINDRTYLYRDTAERLFGALGCEMEVDTNTQVVKIYN